MLASGDPTARVSPQSHNSGCTMRVRNGKGRSVGEVPGGARRTRRGGGLGRAQPADPAAGAGARGCAARGQRGGHADPLGFDYEVSARVTVAAEVERGRHGPGLRPAARRHLPRPARPARSTSPPTGTKVTVTCGASRFTLLTMPVEDYPTLPHHAGGRPAPSPATCSPRRSPRSTIAAGRDDTLPDADRRPDRDRGRQGHPARHRPLPAARCASCTWTPEATDASARRPGPGPHPVRHRQGARPAGDASTLALSSSARGEGLIGFEAGRPPHHHPAARRRVPQGPLALPRPSVDTDAVVETAALVEAVKRVALVAERNTPVRLQLRRGRGRPRGRRRATTPRPARRSRPRSTARTSRSPSTRSSCWTASARSARRTPGCRSPQPTKPAVLARPEPRRDGEAGRRRYRYLLMPVRLAG